MSESGHRSCSIHPSVYHLAPIFSPSVVGGGRGGCGGRTRKALRTLALFVLIEGLALLISVAAIIERPPLLYRIEEERPTGTIVTSDIPRDADLASRYAVVVLRTLSYVLLSPQGGQSSAPLSNLFQLDEKSGRLRTATVIDRDVICRQQLVCAVKLDVVVHPAK